MTKQTEELTDIIAEFRALCAIPHASGQERAIRAYLKRRLEELGLSVSEDAAGNLMAEAPAQHMVSDAPPILLQAHMDMVVVDNASPEKTTVHLVDRDGLLCSDGRTTLGADNGIGVAVILFLLQCRQLRRGPLRVLFTVSEETGLRGARQVSAAWLRDARYLINTDGFHADTMLIGCKGGLRVSFMRPVQRQSTPAGLSALQVGLSGFLGGHSGDDIDRGRCNAVAMMAQLLQAVPQKIRVAAFSGGTGFNVIPTCCTATVLVEEEGEETLRAALHRAAEQLLQPYRRTDPDGVLSLERIACPDTCWTADFQECTLRLLLGCCGGIYERDAKSGEVSSSCNLGEAYERDGQFYVHEMLRCDYALQEDSVLFQMRMTARHTQFVDSVEGYHGWHSDTGGALSNTVAQVYQRQTGKAMKIKTALVGVEPAYFHEKAPALEIVCLGAEIKDAHSVHETVRQDSILQLARILMETVERLSTGQ